MTWIDRPGKYGSDGGCFVRIGLCCIYYRVFKVDYRIRRCPWAVNKRDRFVARHLGDEALGFSLNGSWGGDYIFSGGI